MTKQESVTAPTNGNYVVCNLSSHNGAVLPIVGAATWGSGAVGVTGTISSANSLVGSTANDEVGYSGVTAFTNGNYVVLSPYWSNGQAAYVGAATWGSGTTGVSGVVSSANSLVGSTASDEVGDAGGVTALATATMWSAPPIGTMARPPMPARRPGGVGLQG